MKTLPRRPIAVRSSGERGELLFIIIANSWRTHVESDYSNEIAEYLLGLLARSSDGTEALKPLSAPVTKVALASSVCVFNFINILFFLAIVVAKSRRVLLFNRFAHPYLSLVVCYISRVWSSNEAQNAVKRCHVFWRYRQRSQLSSRISWPADFQIHIPWRGRQRAANSWYKFLFWMSRLSVCRCGCVCWW